MGRGVGGKLNSGEPYVLIRSGEAAGKKQDRRKRATTRAGHLPGEGIPLVQDALACTGYSDFLHHPAHGPLNQSFGGLHWSLFCDFQLNVP